MNPVLKPEDQIFAERYSWIFKNNPEGADNDFVIYMAEIATPLGPMLVGSTLHGLCLLEFANRVRLEKEIADLRILLKGRIIPGKNQYSVQVETELAEYFQGRRKIFSVPLHTPGNDFAQTVWQSLLQIPYGQTCTYKEQAERMNNPKAIRAIASTNGRNRLAIIIPCHRVIGSNGTMTGYAAGTDKKKWLLMFERSNSISKENLLF